MDEEEKDLALEEKRESNLEARISEAILNMKDGEETTIPIPGDKINLEIKIEKSENGYIVNLLGQNIATTDIDGKNLKYNIEGLKMVRTRLEELGDANLYEDLGLPDIEYLEELEKEQNEKDKEKKGDEEKADEEEPELEEDEEEQEEEEEKEEEEKEEEEKKKPVDEKNKAKNLTEINSKVIKLLLPSARQYGKIYLNSDGEIVGRNKQTKEIEPVSGISLMKGSSVNKQIHGTESGEHKHVNAEKLYQIDSRPTTGFAVTRDMSQKGNMNLKFLTRRVGSNEVKDMSFVDLPLLRHEGEVSYERIMESSGQRKGRYGQGDIDKVQDERDEAEDREIPEDIYKRFDEKMMLEENGITDMKQLKQMLADSIKEVLDKDHPNDFPGAHQKQAEEMSELIIDEDKTYKEAEKEVIERNSKEDKSKEDDDGFMPIPGMGRRREH